MTENVREERTALIAFLRLRRRRRDDWQRIWWIDYTTKRVYYRV